MSEQRLQKFLENTNTNTFFIHPVINLEVEKHISSLGNNKSSDIYGLSVKIVKMLSTHIIVYLSNLFSKRFEKLIF